MAEVDELKTVFEHLVQAVSEGNLDTLSAQAHEHIVFLGSLSPIRVEGKAAFLQFFQGFSAAHTNVRVTSLEPHFRAIGPIGLVWGSLVLELHPKREEVRTLCLRYSCTYGHLGERWTLVSMHTSWLLSSD
jgi:ketosteroid isomerase-like protein